MALFFKPFLRNSSLFKQNTLFHMSAALQTLIHDVSDEVFILKLPEGNAHVTYKRLNGVIDLKHTYVPEIFRGKGVAAALAKEVMEYCLKNKIKVKVSCSYLERYVAANFKQYKAIVI